MTPQELITKLVNCKGECLRYCSYCPDEKEIAEIKECVEEMQREIYTAQRHEDELMRDIVKILRAYRKETGHDFRFEEDDNDR